MSDSLAVRPASAAGAGVSDHLFRSICPVLALFNLGCMIFFFAVRWHEQPPNAEFGHERSFALLAIFLVASVWVLGYTSARYRAATLLTQTAVTLFVLLLALSEIGIILFGEHLPAAITDFIPELSGSRPRDIVEYLPDSPWVKFKPNVTVRTVGSRGRDATYSPLWQTDSLGFKNPPGLAAATNVTAVAIGDSFVEGFGTPIRGVWTAILSDRGFRTYNLGVMGYAPQQAVGALTQYGLRFHPKYVIFGYTPGFEDRAPTYVDVARVKREKRATGGIKNLIRYMDERRVRFRHLRFTNGLLSAIERSFLAAYVNARAWANDRRHLSMFSRYRYEIELADKIHFDVRSLDWKLMQESLSEAKRVAEQNNATPVVLLFTQRSRLYYQAAMNKPISENHYEIMATRAVRSWCEANHVDVIDTYPAFERYMQSLPPNPSLAQLPYYEFDGHPSEIGNRIIADVVTDYFRAKEGRS